MTFDPESLYAKPSPGRSIRPAVFISGGALVVMTVIGIMTKPYWWPETTGQLLGQDIKSNNSNTPAPPLNFQAFYSPAVYPPPAPPPDDKKDTPVAKPTPAPVARGPAGPPKKRGIPPEERISSLVLEGNQPPDAANAPAGPSGASGVQGGVLPVSDTRGSKEGFYGAAGSRSEAFRPTGIVGQLGPCALRPGSFIFHETSGVISSDTPGQITARTSRPIYAGPKGQCYAAPAGATLVGTFNSNTSYGDARIQVAWTAMILPNGRMIDLGGMPGAGGNGAAGLDADVNNHTGSLALAVLAGTAVDVVRGMASFGGGGGEGNDVVVGIGGALADRSASVAEKLVDRELSRKPTLTAKREEMTVQVTRPIELEPYQD